MEALEHIIKKLNKIENTQQEMDKKINGIVQKQKETNQIDRRLEEIHFNPLKSQQQKDTHSIEDNDSCEEVAPVLKDIWIKTTETIKKELTEVSYNTWIKTIRPLKLENGKIYLIAASEFAVEIIKYRYISLIQNVIRLVSGKEHEIEISTEKKEEKINL